jgi:hypothetical protein
MVVVGACAGLIVIGFALETVAPPLGTVVALVGMAVLALYLAAVVVYAWRGDQKRPWDPGSLRREYEAEQRAKRTQGRSIDDR